MTKRLEPDPELDALVGKLNRAARDEPTPSPSADDDPDVPARTDPAAATAPAVRRWTLEPATDEGRDWARRLVESARDRGSSDLLLVVDRPPIVRIDGRLEPLETASLSSSATEMLAAALVPRARRDALLRDGSADFAIGIDGVGRLRCNVHRERGRWAASLRLLPEVVPQLDALLLPAVLGRFAELGSGLVLVTGPTGSGKSTTLAAIVRAIVERRRVHVVTIEDPVEYEHAHGECVVEHVEVGRDTTSFPEAIRAALRQDPDVLLIGEMRDAESISTAITAAETGHLVLATLHTSDAPQTIHRILDSYPAGQVEQVRAQLSISLAAVVSQQLLPRRDGPGRVPAVEVLLATNAVRNLIRQGKIEQLRSQLSLESRSGMLALDRSLADLVARGLVDLDEARRRARSPEELELNVQRARGGG